MSRKPDPYGIDLFQALYEAISEHLEEFKESFDYPDYCGIPSRISNKLSSDAVDRIQEIQEDFRSGHLKTRKQLYRELKNMFFLLS